VTAKRKEEKYTGIACIYNIFTTAFDTFGPINQVGADFISALDHRISSNTDDPRVKFFHLQRFSVAIQRFNAVCF
jgi:hypothetical protein